MCLVWTKLFLKLCVAGPYASLWREIIYWGIKERKLVVKRKCSLQSLLTVNSSLLLAHCAWVRFGVRLGTCHHARASETISEVNIIIWGCGDHFAICSLRRSPFAIIRMFFSLFTLILAGGTAFFIVSILVYTPLYFAKKAMALVTIHWKDFYHELS